MLKGTSLLTIYDYVKLYIGYFSNRIPDWEGIFSEWKSVGLELAIPMMYHT